MIATSIQKASLIMKPNTLQAIDEDLEDDPVIQQ